MNTEQLKTLLGDLATISADERAQEEDIAQYLTAACPPAVKRRVEALMAEDVEFRTEMAARQAEAANFTSARLVAFEERILLAAGIDTEGDVLEPAPQRPSAISEALAEVISACRIVVAILRGPVLAFDTEKPENESRDHTAIARLFPARDGIEIEVVSRNASDAGARIEVFVQPGSWRAELTLKKGLQAADEVRASVQLSREQLRAFSPDAEILLRHVA